ncbi:unnamed protein product [Effrenium voratum]|nr:unnamed protein product [Effrenium voratum]
MFSQSSSCLHEDLRRREPQGGGDGGNCLALDNSLREFRDSDLMATESGDGGEGAADEADPEEKVHKLKVQMPMVQAGEVPFELVWQDLLEGGEALLQASPDGTWTSIGWKDRSEMQETFKASLEAHGQGTLARGMTLEQANMLLERLDEMADAMVVVADRTDLPRSPHPKKSVTEGAVCRRVQLQSGRSPTVGVAVWEHPDGSLDVVDQQGRFLPQVPSSQILAPARRARHAHGRAVPLELSVLGLSGARGEESGYEWQFAGDQGWCRFDAAASRQLEAAQQRGEDSVSVRSGTTRYLVDIRAGTQTNMTHPGRRVRRVRRLATGPGRNAISAHPSLERNFSAVDRGPVNDFEQKVLERKLGEEHFRQEEDTQTDPSIQMELDRGEAAPRLRVDFFKESPLPAECTLLQALLWPEPAAMRQVEQRLRYTVSTSRAASSLGCQAKESKLQRDHTGVQAAGRAGAEGDSATLLALLRRLRRQGHPGIRWENDQLNRKLAHQLSQPLLTAGGVVPAWVKALPLTYPFLFERKLKEQLLHCMGFGTSHAVLWLQRRCVEARFGEQLRNARERRGIPEGAALFNQGFSLGFGLSGNHLLVGHVLQSPTREFRRATLPRFSAMSGRPVASASRLVIFAILFLLTGYVTIVPFLVPKAQVGIILSTQGWASVAALIPSGFAIDKYGAKAILQLGVAMAMGGIALAASASFHSQLISRVVVGAATSVIFNAAMALIMEHFVEPLRSEHLGLAVGLGSLGNVAGPLLVGALFDGARMGGLPEPQFWCLVPPLLGFAAVWQMLRAVPDKSEPLLDPEDDSSLLAKACGGVFLFRRAKVLVLTLELVCIFAANNAFMTLGAIELHRRGFSSSQIGMMTMPSGLFQCLLSQWAGRFAGSAVNRERVLLATPLLLGLALLPLSLLGDRWLVPQLLAALVLSSAAQGATDAPAMSMMADLAKARGSDRGSADRRIGSPSNWCP